MSRTTLPVDCHQSIQAIRDRCAQLGLPTWICDRQGKMLSEPSETGPIGLWLKSSMMSRLVESWVQSGHVKKDPDAVRELIPGCWIVMINNARPSQDSRLLLAVILTQDLLGSEQFTASCVAASLDPRATAQSLSDIILANRASVPWLAQSLHWMARDLYELDVLDQAVDEFSTQLNSAYETIDVLYAFGHSMKDLRSPERFIRLVCDRLHETMSFGWITIGMASQENHELEKLVQTAGDLPMPAYIQQDLIDQLVVQDQMVSSGPQLIDSLPGINTLNQVQFLVQPITRDGSTAGLIIAGEKTGPDSQVSSYEMRLIEAAAGYVGAFVENASLYASQEALFMGTLGALTSSIDAKDRYTCGHSERVAYMAKSISLAIGMSEDEAERIHIAGLIHDVGKIGVPEAVLTKPGKLTVEEFDKIKKHPEIGYRILADIPLLSDILPAVLYHHERWDGKGYPYGISGQSIPLIARIVCLADTFDAMSSTRSYRAAMPREKVLQEIRDCAGTQFDPELTPFIDRIDLMVYDKMVQKHAEEQMHMKNSAASRSSAA